MLAMPNRIAALLTSVLVAVVLGCLHSTRAWAMELPCIAGHHTVVLPCTFDGGLLSLDAGIADFGGGMGGQQTMISFSGAGIEIACDLNCPYQASDETGGTNGTSTTFMISTVSGLPLIDNLSLTLLDPSVTVGRTISWRLGTASGDQTMDFGELIFDTPQSSITQRAAITLSAGCTPEPCSGGNASVSGVLFNVSLVPEPDNVLLLRVGLFGMLLFVRIRPTYCT
jgi:hypothetical protein